MFQIFCVSNLFNSFRWITKEITILTEWDKVSNTIPSVACYLSIFLFLSLSHTRAPSLSLSLSLSQNLSRELSLSSIGLSLSLSIYIYIHLSYSISHSFSLSPLSLSLSPSLDLSPSLALFLSRLLSLSFYADDMVLIANSEEGLRRELDIASCYSRKWRFWFNPSKCSVVVFEKDKALRKDKFKMGKELIKVVDGEMHLGIWLSNSKTSNAE